MVSNVEDNRRAAQAVAEDRAVYRRVRLTERLRRTFGWLLPAGKYQYRRMAVKRAGEDLRTFNAETHPVALDRGQRRLWNAAQFGKRILTKTLQLANDTHGFAY